MGSETDELCERIAGSNWAARVLNVDGRLTLARDVRSAIASRDARIAELEARERSARDALAEYGWDTASVSVADLAHGLGLERTAREDRIAELEAALVALADATERAIAAAEDDPSYNVRQDEWGLATEKARAALRPAPDRKETP